MGRCDISVTKLELHWDIQIADRVSVTLV